MLPERIVARPSSPSALSLAAPALLDANPEPTEHEIRRAIQGNICRCTGYVNIVEAIASAARGGTA